MIEKAYATAVTLTAVCTAFAGRLPDPEKNPCRQKLDQMAFNCHRVWSSGINGDARQEFSRFRKDSYSYFSSIDNAVSALSKLSSLGIDPADPFRAAGEYDGLLRESPDLRRELIACEQHRWTVAKATEGYSCLSDMRTAAELYAKTGRIYDKAGKLHPCMVPSSSSDALERFNGWDDPDADLSALDDLDRVSVKIHRAAAELAGEHRRSQQLSGNTVRSIRTIIRGESLAEQAFDEWLSVMTLIRNRQRGYNKRYQGLIESFVKTFDYFNETEKKNLQRHTDGLKKEFAYSYGSMAYTNYKNNDGNLVDRLPFILTYRDRDSFGIRSDTLFVKDLEIPDEKNAELLRELSGAGCINDMTVTDRGQVSFTSPSQQLMELLTTESRALESYCYARLIASELFDEAAAFCPGGEENGGPADILLVKGFLALIVRCVTDRIPQKEDYDALSRIADRTGFHMFGVILTDGAGQQDSVNAEYGKRLGIATVCAESGLNDPAAVFGTIPAEYRRKQ